MLIIITACAVAIGVLSLEHILKRVLRRKTSIKPRIKTLDAVILWAKGDLEHKEAAVGYLKNYLSDAFIKFLAMGVEAPSNFTFDKQVYSDSDFTKRTMILAKNTKTEYATIIYDPTHSTTLTWTNAKKQVTGKVSLERDTVLYIHFKTDDKGDNTTVTYEEKPEYKDGINALVLKVINTIASRSMDAELTPAHKAVLDLLNRYPAEAVRFLDDPIFSEHAKKLMEGIK